MEDVGSDFGVVVAAVDAAPHEKRTDDSAEQPFDVAVLFLLFLFHGTDWMVDMVDRVVVCRAADGAGIVAVVVDSAAEWVGACLGAPSFDPSKSFRGSVNASPLGERRVVRIWSSRCYSIDSVSA